MENKSFKNIDENPMMIVLGVLAFYFLVEIFIFYLYFLHRISLFSALISTLIFTCIYLTRFVILFKLKNKDIIKITDSSIFINNQEVEFGDIVDYRVQEKKPQVVFFMNSKAIVFQEAIFYLKLSGRQVSFNAIGSEKISLLKSFLDELLGR